MSLGEVLTSERVDQPRHQEVRDDTDAEQKHDAPSQQPVDHASIIRGSSHRFSSLAIAAAESSARSH